MLRNTFKELWNTTLLRVVFLVACIYGIVVVLRLTRVAWASFLIAFLIAYLVEPLVLKLKSKGIARWLSMSSVMLAIALFLTLSIFVAVDVLIQLALLPRVLLQFLNEFPIQLETFAPPWFKVLFDDDTNALENFFSLQQALLLGWFKTQTRSVIQEIGSVLGLFWSSIVVLFLTGFMISSYPMITKSLLIAIPHRYQHTTHDLIHKLDISVGGYVRAQVWRSVIIGFILWLVFAVLGVPKAGAVAFLSALLNPIPYLGNIVATVPAVLLSLTISWQLALICLIVCILIQLLDGNILQNIVFSQSLNVQPVTIILALLVGGALGGFWGLMLAIPLAAFLQLLYRDYYLRSVWYVKGRLTKS